MNEKISNMANSFDWEYKSMVILVEVLETSIIKKNIKNIICPKCKEICFININNYKISLNNCKNKHQIENLMIKEFDTKQNFDLKYILCDKCKIKDMSSSENKIFYKWFICNKNLCLQCKSQHDRNHKIIDYDDKDYNSSKHIQPFISYCKNYNKNLCQSCQKEYNEHEIINFNDIMLDESTLENNLRELKKKLKLYKKK